MFGGWGLLGHSVLYEETKFGAVEAVPAVTWQSQEPDFHLLPRLHMAFHELSSTLWFPVWHCGDDLISECLGFCCIRLFLLSTCFLAGFVLKRDSF